MYAVIANAYTSEQDADDFQGSRGREIVVTRDVSNDTPRAGDVRTIGNSNESIKCDDRLI